ncbi:MAG: hypothetical protein AAF337_00100 [Pseudomonadota bacterium]
MTARKVLLAGCAIFFSFGLLAGYAQAEGPALDLVPQTDDTIASGVPADNDIILPAEPIPSDPDEGDSFLYNLVEPSETVTDLAIIYAV